MPPLRPLAAAEKIVGKNQVRGRFQPFKAWDTALSHHKLLNIPAKDTENREKGVKRGERIRWVGK